MNYREHPVLFECGADELVGIVAVPDRPVTGTGLLVLVGGPQYRVGSHRQFLLLSRRLAAEGVPCLRFDFRGCGDSTGEPRDFESLNEDIDAAIDAFFAMVPQLERIVLWGLCDGASAACLYAPADPRVAGLVLLNPWVHTETGQARTYLKHYYLRRLIDPGFWKKLGRGGVVLRDSIGDLLRTTRHARSGRQAGGGTLPERMAAGLATGGRPFMVVLSGRDYVAREFEELVKTDPVWAELMAAADLWRIEDADHTFSSAPWRENIARLTRDWVSRLQR